MKSLATLLTMDRKTCESAKRLFREYNLPIRCQSIGVEDPETIGLELVDAGVKVIIARGGVAGRLQKTVPALIVPLSYDFLDFQRPIIQACQQAGQVAVAGWYSHLLWFDEYKVMLPTHIRYYDLPNYGRPRYQDLLNTVYQMKKDGVEAVVGGVVVVEEAQKQGLQGYLVEVSDAALLQAGEEALHYVKILEERDRWLQITETILENVPEGVIYAAPDNAVPLINQRAKQMLEAFLPELSGPFALEEIAPLAPLLHTIGQGRNITNKVLNLAGSKAVLNTQALERGSQPIGTLVSLQALDSIRSMDRSVQKDVIESGRYAKYSFDDIIGRSPAIEKAKFSAQRYANGKATILITGESGTGKELFAQSIHNASPRRNEPFVAINCAALPESILESELFGYVKGAFTGARNEGKLGIFELANKGTIFLDEIGEVSPKLQARLLRVLQEREITRIGDHRVIPIDVRVIAATNRDLVKMVQNREFREDLFYRICVLSLQLPPLRERKEDIPLLLDSLLWAAGRENSVFSKQAAARMDGYDWPGNVRELSNFVERLCALESGSSFGVEIVELAMAQPGRPSGKFSAEEREDPDALVLRTLRQCLGNRQKTAERLGISRNTLWRRLKEIELRRGSLEEGETDVSNQTK